VPNANRLLFNLFQAHDSSINTSRQHKFPLTGTIGTGLKTNGIWLSPEDKETFIL